MVRRHGGRDAAEDGEAATICRGEEEELTRRASESVPRRGDRGKSYARWVTDDAGPGSS
jgi:hypothetical protein